MGSGKGKRAGKAEKGEGEREGCDYDSEERRRWRKWALRFGERMRGWGDEVGERAGYWGNRFADKVEEELGKEGGNMAGDDGETKAHKVRGEWMDAKWHRRWQEHRAGSWWGGWWMWPFGLIGPLIGAGFTLLFVVVAVMCLKFVTAGVQSEFLSLMIGAVAASIWVFFAFSLIMGYFDFLIKRHPMAYLVLWPLSNSLGIALSAWIISWVLRTVGELASVALLVQAGALLKAYLLPIFVVFAAIGYVSLWMMERK